MSLYLVIMGVQGAGKGTQADFIRQEYTIPHISTGDLFRAMRTREDELARRIQEIMKAGHLVPDDVTNEVAKDRLEQPDAANGVILDGFPRNIVQAQWLDSYLADKGEKLTAVLMLELDLYTAFKRAFGRVKSGQSGQTYNIYYNNGELDVKFIDHPEKAFPPRIEARLKESGELLERRPDDEAAAVVKRIDIYMEETRPLVEYYRQQGFLVEIDAGQAIEDVSRAIKTAIERDKEH
jgi:adenylate kinase